jgi:hypothetical protein
MSSSLELDQPVAQYVSLNGEQTELMVQQIHSNLSEIFVTVSKNGAVKIRTVTQPNIEVTIDHHEPRSELANIIIKNVDLILEDQGLNAYRRMITQPLIQFTQRHKIPPWMPMPANSY